METEQNENSKKGGKFDKKNETKSETVLKK